MSEFERQPDGKQSMWSPDGIEGIGAGGDTFPAEATVSHFEMNGQPFYTVILCHVNERLEAEIRIRTLIAETDYRRGEIHTLQGFDAIIGESDALRRGRQHYRPHHRGDGYG
jgi:hypothetical protein